MVINSVGGSLGHSFLLTGGQPFRHSPLFRVATPFSRMPVFRHARFCARPPLVSPLPSFRGPALLHFAVARADRSVMAVIATIWKKENSGIILLFIYFKRRSCVYFSVTVLVWYPIDIPQNEICNTNSFSIEEIRKRLL